MYQIKRQLRSAEVRAFVNAAGDLATLIRQMSREPRRTCPTDGCLLMPGETACPMCVARTLARRDAMAKSTGRRSPVRSAAELRAQIQANGGEVEGASLVIPSAIRVNRRTPSGVAKATGARR